ncbi:MAG: hypothetical protein ACP5HX_06065 [Thermoproteota archaeon]
MTLRKLLHPILNLVVLVVLPLALNYYVTSNYGTLLEQLEVLTNIRIQNSFMFTTVIGIMITILSIVKSFSNKASFINLLSSLGVSFLWFLLLSFIVSFGQFGEGLIGISTFYVKVSPSAPISEAIIVKFNFSFIVLLLAFSLALSILADILAFREERRKIQSVGEVQ